MSEVRAVTPATPSGAAPSRAAALVDALFAHATVGMAFWDAELRYERVNDELAAMNGLAVADHVGRRPTEVLPALGTWLEETLRRVMDTGEAVRGLGIDGETPAAPGLIRHWVADYLPVRDAGGAI